MTMISVLEKQYMETVIRMGRRLQNGEVDWEQRRYEIAKAMFASPHHLTAEEAVMNADELIAELKKDKKPQEKK